MADHSLFRGPREWRLAALLIAAVIVVFGLIPTHEALQALAGERESAATVAGPVLEYAALAFVLPLALRGWGATARTMLLAGLLCIVLGIGIELVQLALPYRSAQLSDAIVDVLGTAVGLGLVSLAGSARARRSRWRPG